MKRVFIIFITLCELCCSCNKSKESTVPLDKNQMQALMSIIDVDEIDEINTIYISELYEKPYIILFIGDGELKQQQSTFIDDTCFRSDPFLLSKEFQSFFSNNEIYEKKINDFFEYDELGSYDYIILTNDSLNSAVPCNQPWTMRILLKNHAGKVYGILDSFNYSQK